MLYLHKQQLWETSLDEDVTALAKAQFDGTGSYGNGAAMRVAPIALFHAADDLKMLVTASIITQIYPNSYWLQNKLGIQNMFIQVCSTGSSIHLP